MWSEAIAMLTRAENMHRQIFQPRAARQQAAWEPPVDVLELDREVLILMALPGVDTDQVEITIEDGVLVVAGRRVLPPELRTAVIHRLELPQGRFERHVALPPGRYAAVQRGAANGCLVLSLRKAA
jgi:HSP20 family molecular chaperone IbpA